MVSNQSLGLNIAAHLFMLTAIAAVLFFKNERLKRQVTDSVIFLLLLTVTIFAAHNGNPAHLITFGLMALFALLELFQGKNYYDVSGINLRIMISWAAIVVGFWYPEFVKANLLAMLILSPAGSIPCPTLLIVLGFLTMAYPKVNKVQYLITVCGGVFYALIGVFQLKVYLDMALILIVGYACYGMFQNRVVTKGERKDVSRN